MDLNAKQIIILETATREFLENGYSAGSTNSISASAGVAKGLIFHYFGSKENLFIETLHYAFHHVALAIDTALAPLSTFMQAFELLDSLLQVKHTQVYLDPLYAPLLANTFQQIAAYPEQLQIEVQALQNKYNAIFQSYLVDLPVSDKLRFMYKSDDTLILKVFNMIESMYLYEINLLPIPITYTAVRKISIAPYICMLEHGLVR